MDFRILGPLEVHGDRGPIALGGTKPRAVLAILLLHGNETVRAEQLALELWGEDVPSSAVKTVQVYVSRLRKALGDPQVLVTTPVGYCLRVRPGELDADRFAALVEDGSEALVAGRAEHAAAVLREALALWRGTALEDLTFEPFAQADISRLDEQRLAALEARVEADLAVGRHAALVGELRGLVAANPTRERLAGQLMLALYRCGRQADALETYRATRRVLVTTVGVEPGPELRRLEEAILRQDATLDPPAPAGELPPELDAARTTPLAGRDAELAWLRDRWARAAGGAGARVAITGEPGSGKTRLAAELAAEVHGQGAAVLYAGGSGPAAALIAALRRAGAAAERTLLVVDDADRADPATLAGLADGGATATVLVLLTGADPASLARLGASDELALGPLGAAAVGAIAAAYAPAAADVPLARLLEASGGVPRAVHELAGRWARGVAARRVGEAAERAAAGRVELRSMESELAGDVIALQAADERTGRAGSGDSTVVCPFKGLASFDVADAPYFFGRERLVAKLVAQLVGAPLLAVVGPSGSGKSSVLRAGLLPALSSGVLPGSEDWPQVIVRPGEHPLRELDDALAGVGRARRIVVAVDQFEETFTACEAEDERAAFITRLAEIAQARDRRAVVLIAVRADYYGRCAAYPQLASLLAANHVLVGPMQREELRRAVECPAQRVGLRVEPELADALVADVEDELGGLPLLSAALLELWQRRDSRTLRYADYEHTGGVRGAVARLAEEAFSQLDPAEQAAARDTLMRLVVEGADGSVERRRARLDELRGASGEDVEPIVALLTDRRLLTVSTGTVEVAHEALLREWPRLREWIEEDREALRTHRSLASAALEWDRHGRDRDAVYRGARLTKAVEWRAERAPSLSELEREFLVASEAAQGRARATRRRRLVLVVGALSVGLVAAVVAALFANQQRADAESRDLAVRSASLLGTDPGVALTLALEARRRSATSAADSALRQATLEQHATRVVPAHRGLANGVAASPDGKLAATAGADGTVRIWSLPSGRRVATIGGFGEGVQAVSFSRDGSRVAGAAFNGTIGVAPARRGGRLDVVARLTDQDVAYGLDFGPGDRKLAIATDNGRAALIELRDRTVQELNPAPGAVAPLWSVAFNEDGSRVVTSGGSGLAEIWDVDGGAPPVQLHHDKNPRGSDDFVLAAAFSPGGRRVATTDEFGSVQLWDARTGRGFGHIAVSDTRQASVRFSADGKLIVTAGVDGAIHVADVRGKAVLADYVGHHGPARAAFVGDGHEIVSAGEEDGTLRTWRAPSAKVPPSPLGIKPRFSLNGALVTSFDLDGPVYVWRPATGERVKLEYLDATNAARFSPDGKQVIGGSELGPVKVWDVAGGPPREIDASSGRTLDVAIAPRTGRIAVAGSVLAVQAPDGSGRVELRGHQGLVNSVAFSPDGERLLSGSDDATARIWDARTGKPERTLNASQGVIRAVSWSYDGTRIATAGTDGTVNVWPVRGGDPVSLVGHTLGVNTAEFNRRGDRIVTAGDDGTVRVWDASSGDGLVVIDRHEGVASGADFSRDGRYVVSAGDEGMRLVPCEVCGSEKDVLRLAHSRPPRRLSALERRRLLPGG